MIPPNFAAIMEQTEQGRAGFFRLAFGSASDLSEEGYICIAYKHQNTGEMRQEFFKYPSQIDKLLASIRNNSRIPAHTYFCPQLLKSKVRNKDNILTCPTAWADLDKCDPALLAVQPSVLLQSSPGNYQALWTFTKPIDGIIAEDISRRIAYFHADSGADRSGWDLSQLLRVPYTVNYKYGDLKTAPIVTILDSSGRVYRESEFDVYPEVPAIAFASEEMPRFETESPLDILQRYRSTLNPIAFGLFSEEPRNDDDWSSRCWKLLRILIEAGLSRPQTFTVMKHAACNKFIRDNRPDNDLWREVLRGYIKTQEYRHSVPNFSKPLPDIISQVEIDAVQERETFVERYISWCQEITDAAPQYHQAGAFITLSSILSGNLKLRTSFGTILPNIWFMILGDTTLTRKTTAMNIAVDLITEIDDEIMFATDGSMEGILTGIKARDGSPALFFRDEFTGLLSAMLNKDYMSDMPEHLTKLYDGKPMRRLLRKEEISVYHPIFLILGGGIKSKVQTLFTEEHIASGFIPRFVFLTAEADLSRTRPVGPPREDDDAFKEIIKNELLDIKNHYENPALVVSRNKEFGKYPKQEVTLTQDAWKRYNEFELTMTRSALDSGFSYLTPVYDRLCKSTLKAAILIAASRQRNISTVVTLQDLLHAIYYCRFWRDYANEIVHGLGKTPEERLIDKIMVQVKNTPGGISKAELMRLHKLNTKQASSIFSTMLDRQMIWQINVSGNQTFYPNPSGR